MVLPDGSVKLLDFGLAKLVEDQGSEERVKLGKIYYSAPEQKEHAHSVDHRADIYSCGVMFYEMLTGTLPKEGERITDVRTELPEAVNTFFDRCTAPDPAERFQTALEAGAFLQRLYKEHRAAEAEPTH